MLTLDKIKLKISLAAAEIKKKEIEEIRRQIKEINNNFVGIEFVSVAQVIRKNEEISRLNKLIEQIKLI